MTACTDIIQQGARNEIVRPSGKNETLQTKIYIWGQVMKVRLSCYLGLLSVDSETK